MRPRKCNLDLYSEFLIATQKQYSCTELENVSPDDQMAHDCINRWLNDSEYTPDMLWGSVEKGIEKDCGYLVFDDTLVDKSFSEKIELVKWQWSGRDHRIKKGIGLITALWVNMDGPTLPVDYRVYQKDIDGKTKNDHFREMLDNADQQRCLKPIYVLMDSWYSSKENLKAVHDKEWFFITELRSNRKVSERKGDWCRLDELGLEEKQVKKVWLKGFGLVMICKHVVKNGTVRYMASNNLKLERYSDFRVHADMRWKIETMHRDLKQACGLAKCYMRKAKAQMNHIFSVFIAWIKMQFRRLETGLTVYQQKWGIVRDSVRNHLAQTSFA
jgi:hypothetical protein